MNLHELEVGQRAMVEKLPTGGGLRRRLQELGLVVGTQVECVLKGPTGDPRAFLISGAVIALRKEDAAQVWISAVGMETVR